MSKLEQGCLAFYEQKMDRWVHISPIFAFSAHVYNSLCRKSRVFCFYGSGQTAVNLRHLNFPETVERCIVELPGRGLRASEPLCDSLVEVAEGVAESLNPLLEDGLPFVAQLLQRHGRHAREADVVLPAVAALAQVVSHVVQARRLRRRGRPAALSRVH